MLQKTRRIVLAATLSTEINAIAMSGFTTVPQVTQYVFSVLILLGASYWLTNLVITKLCAHDVCDYGQQRWADRAALLHASFGAWVIIATFF